MEEKTISRRQLAFLLEIMVAVPRLIELVERTGGTTASSEHFLGVRRLPDGRRVRIKVVAEVISPTGGASTPSPAERNTHLRRRG